jgi:two-component system, NtrC family, response regulator AtoC
MGTAQGVVRLQVAVAILARALFLEATGSLDRRIVDVATGAAGEHSGARKDLSGSLLPALRGVRTVAGAIATGVGLEASGAEVVPKASLRSTLQLGRGHAVGARGSAGGVRRVAALYTHRKGEKPMAIESLDGKTSERPRFAPSRIVATEKLLPTFRKALADDAVSVISCPVDDSEDVEMDSLTNLIAREAAAGGSALEGGGSFGMAGTSASMRRVFERIRLVAPTRSTSLITGESGTGKELVARAIHQLSPRKDGPFVALNCAAIPKDLAESELFGHARGAFTGAVEKRLGQLPAANHGTLLIDEIGEMDLAIQAKLLRALETRAITPVGSNEEHVLDVRVLVATHRDLRALVAEGKFREDLYYRLHVVPIELPPLRDRPEDIPLLIAAFLPPLNKEHRRNVGEVSPEAMSCLRRHHWPGNVRELRNVLEGVVVLSRKPVIERDDLPPEIQPSKGVPLEGWPRFHPGITLVKLECEAIQRCLLQTGGSRQESPRLLGISVRTLLRKIRKYRLQDPLRPASSNESPALTLPWLERPARAGALGLTGSD